MLAEIKKLEINLNCHFDKTVIPKLNSGQALTKVRICLKA